MKTSLKLRANATENRSGLKRIFIFQAPFLGGELFEGYLCVATGRESDAFSTAKFVKFGKFPKFRLSLESISADLKVQKTTVQGGPPF